jgi:hypothetical protein
VRFNNAALQTKLFALPGGEDALKAVGFEENVEDGQKVFIVSDPPPSTFGQIKTMLDAAVEDLKHAGQ